MQKLQNVKAESEREVSSLKRKVQELERQLSLTTKRRKLWSPIEAVYSSLQTWTFFMNVPYV